MDCHLRLKQFLKFFFSLVFLSALFYWACGSIKLPRITSRTSEATETWPLYGGGPGRNSYRNKIATPPFKHFWTYKTTAAIGKNIAVVNGVVFAPTLDGRIDAIDIENGSRLGRMKTDDRYESTCAIQSNFLTIASRYGRNTLSVYNLETGKYKWMLDAGDIASEPLVTDTAIYVAALYNHIDKYNLQTGERIWKFESAGQHRSSPALGQGTLVVGCDNGVLYALDSKKGEQKWRVETGASIFATPVIHEDTIFIGSTDSVFYSINLEDGDLQWSFKTDGPIYESAATDGGLVCFGSSAGTFYCLNADSGEQLWSFKAGSLISTAPLMLKDLVVFGSLDKHYYALNLDEGEEVWRFKTNGRIRTTPVTWEKYIIGGSEEKYLFAFLMEN